MAEPCNPRACHQDPAEEIPRPKKKRPDSYLDSRKSRSESDHFMYSSKRFINRVTDLYVVRMTGDRGNLTSFAFLDARNRSACRQNRRFVRRILSSRQNPSLQLVFPIYLLTSTRSQARIIRSEDYSKHASTSHRSPCTILLCHSVHKLACQVTDPGLAYMVVGGFVVAVSISPGKCSLLYLLTWPEVLYVLIVCQREGACSCPQPISYPLTGVYAPSSFISMKLSSEPHAASYLGHIVPTCSIHVPGAET